MKQLKKTILTLVALLALTTGAWAQDPNAVTAAEINSELYSGWSSIDGKLLKASELPGFQAVTEDQAKSWTGVPSTGKVWLYYKFVADGNVKVIEFENGVYVSSFEDNDLTCYLIWEDIKYSGDKKYFYTTGPAPSGPEVAWDEAKKTGSFTMPGGNVTLEPDYYPQATAADGAVTAADDDARATTDDPLVKVDATKLTGAKKLMYFVSNSDDTPAYDAEGWTDQLPTAEGFTQQGIVYVYYYPVGTDDEDPAKTYSDGDICLQSITARIADAPTYAVTFADDTAEPDKWTADPAAGVTKGQTVTVTYSGSKKIIGVKAEKKAAASAPSLNITSPEVGHVIGSDGKNYDANATLPTGVTAVAVIAYLGSDTYDATFKNGLAIALADEKGDMIWSTAKSTCEGKTAITGAKWCLPSQDQWKQMFKANGGDEDSYTGLITTITTAGGATLLEDEVAYWSSSECTPNVSAYFVFLTGGNAQWIEGNEAPDGCRVRAVLAF